MHRAKTRKRPCKICRKWFLPHPRQGDRQKTCGRPECQREYHRRLRQKWNDKNRAYFKANYLTEKLKRTKAPPDCVPEKPPPDVPKSRIHLSLPRDVIIEKIGGEHLIILEYVVEQVIRRNLNISGCHSP